MNNQGGSVSSEFGDDPEIDSPDLVEEEEDFEEESNLDWSDEGFDESEIPAMERPVAPDVEDFTTQEDYDTAYEEYERAHEDYQSQMPTQQDASELDVEVYNNLDRLGMTGASKPLARQAIKEADGHLLKAQNATMRGDEGAAREHRMRAEYMSRTAQKEMEKPSAAQAQGQKEALKQYSSQI